MAWISRRPSPVPARRQQGGGEYPLCPFPNDTTGRPCIRKSTASNKRAINIKCSYWKCYVIRIRRRFKYYIYVRRSSAFQLTHKFYTSVHFSIRPVTNRKTRTRYDDVLWSKSESLWFFIILIANGIMVRPTIIKISVVIFGIFYDVHDKKRWKRFFSLYCDVWQIHIRTVFFLFRHTINAIVFPTRAHGDVLYGFMVIT